MRHSHATELVNAGVTLATIRKRLGHRNLQTTCATRTRPTPSRTPNYAPGGHAEIATVDWVTKSGRRLTRDSSGNSSQHECQQPYARQSEAQRRKWRQPAIQT
ncbi:MAG: tyrosine-type recombinase/integrase [Actinomycetota bacterium]|nr:tyrosine-type recombinase/integrase [Actinomycetota bacterium]